MRSRLVFTPDLPPMEPINSGVDDLLRTTYHTDAVFIETKKDGMSIFHSIVLFVRLLGGKLGLQIDRDRPYLLLRGLQTVWQTVATMTLLMREPFPHHVFEPI